MIPDVNVLVSAVRPDHVHHQVALDWLRRALEGARRGDELLLLTSVVAGYLRVATNPRIWLEPTPVAIACDFIDDLVAQPGVTMRFAGGEWPVLRKLCIEQSLAGNRVPDAWIAAIVMRADDTLATFDRGFRGLLDARRLVLLTAAR